MKRWLTAGRGALLTAVVVLLVAGSYVLLAQTIPGRRTPNISNGRPIYNDVCITCHGPKGNGAAQTSTEFKRPGTFPDFTRCDQTTPEADSAWKTVIVHGGPNFGLSTIMPSFGQLLSN